MRRDGLCDQLHVYFSNCTSVCNKLTELQSHVTIHEFDIVVLNETWLTADTPNHLILPSHVIYRKDREGRRGGGTLIAIKQGVLHYREDSFDHKHIDGIWVAVLNKSRKPFLIGTMYRPPQDNAFFKHAKAVFKTLSQNAHKYSSITLIGDFNTDWAPLLDGVRCTRDLITLYTTTASIGLKQLVHDFTHKHSERSGSTVLDLAFTNDSSSFCIPVDNLTSTCHHRALRVTINCLPERVDCKKPTQLRLYKKANFEGISEKLRELDWDVLFDEINSDSLRPTEQAISLFFIKWYTHVTQIIHDHTPVQDIVDNHNDKLPWIDQEVRTALKEKRTLFRISRVNSSYWPQYNEMTDRISSMIRNKEKQYLENLILEDRNLTKVCALVSGKKYQKSTGIMLVTDSQERTFTKGQEIAQAFNSYYTSVYNDGSVVTDSECDVDDNDGFLTMNDVMIALRDYNYKAAVGDYSIPNAVLKNCASCLARPFFLLYTLFVKSNRIPDVLKCTRISPVLKPGKPNDKVTSYRPVAVSSNIIKIFDMIINTKLTTQLYNNNLLSKSQYGFVSGHSCETLLIDFMSLLYSAFENKKTRCVDVILLDLSSAFDKVIHSSLINKMSDLTIDSKIVNTVREELTDRWQYVACNGYVSQKSSVSSGVIQGGIMSPALFNVYVADLNERIVHSGLFQYADDTMLVKTITSKEDVALLQRDLNTLFFTCQEKGLIFNATKSAHLRIQLKQRSVGELDGIPYSVNGETVPLVDFSRYLGITIDTYLTFHVQCDERILKATQCWGKIKTAFKNVHGDIMLKLYRIHVLPVLEYGLCTITLSQTDMNRLERVQKKISKSISYHLCQDGIQGYNNRLQRLNLMSITNRYYFRLTQMIAKRKFNYSSLPLTVNVVTFKATRTDGEIAQFPFTSLHHTDKWVVCTAVTEYNRLPKTIRGLGKLSLFKQHCRSHYYTKSFHPENVEGIVGD